MMWYMKLNFVFYVLCFLIKFAWTFNFFPKHAYVFTNNNPESFFGYSVLLQSSSNANLSRLIVGAPRANSSSVLHKNLFEPGGVYSCSLSDKICTQYLLYLNENTEERSRERDLYKNKKDNAWLGCSIDGSDDPNGSLVACAPRWVNEAISNYYFMQGICYYLQDSTQIEKKSEILLPLLNKGKQGYIRANETVYYYAYGEAGMSVHISKKNLNILIGAPGILQWRGMALKYNYHYLDNLRISYNQENIPNPNNINSIEDFSLFGYTVSSGIFLRSSNQIWYVAGAPRGNMLKGQVLIYEYEEGGNDLKIHYEMTGRQHGEYFGAGLSVGDINGDGVDDIIVGGSLYSTSLEHDTGCAYLYLNDGLGKFTRSIIEGEKKSGARFGSAISIIGDINDDNYSDVVISAPYFDDNRGAIFIYHGSETGVKEKYSQMIVATEINDALRGFGLSISRGIDIDSNMYNDIAVGSYLSGHAVIIKTRPVVRIEGTLTTANNQISIQTQSIPVSACISYSGKHLPLSLNIKIILIIDPFYNRAFINKLNNNYGTMWEVTKSYKHGQILCEDISISILKVNFDVTQPIAISMEYALAETKPEDGTFCATCPVEDKSTSNSTNLLIYYETGCGEDEFCEPDLSIKAYFDFKNPYIVQGRDDLIKINVEIINIAEPAYAAKLYAKIPLSAAFSTIPGVCQSMENNLLLCDLGKPLYQNKTVKFVLPIDISLIKPGEPFHVELNVTSLGSDINLDDNVIVLQKEVKSEIQISVIGISDPEQITLVEDNADNMELNKLRFTHTYMVQNLGPSAIHDLQIKFLIPQKYNKHEADLLEIYENYSSNLQCYRPGLNNTVYNNETKKITKILLRRSVSGPTSITLMQSALFSKMQKISGSDNILPPNIPLNRLISLNCVENSDVICIAVECINDGILERYDQVTVTFSLVANYPLINTIREDKDVIAVTTSFLPTSDMFTGNWTYTHTLLHGSIKTNYPIKWIVIASVLGILIMTIIVFTLYKTGFFKRHSHEKLLNEKGEFIETENQ